ncbi:hypothetical protein HYU12_00785 [Candidatus Woesearchaeota archaeon]|nr:hypothetical protein [Candidatus Woesearchaeota archaeon]
MTFNHIAAAMDSLKEPKGNLALLLRKIEQDKKEPDEYSWHKDTEVELRQSGLYTVIEVRKHYAPSSTLSKDVFTFALKDGTVKGFKLHQIYRPDLETIKAGILGNITYQFGVYWRNYDAVRHGIILGVEKLDKEPTIDYLEELALVRGLFYNGDVEGQIPLAEVQLENHISILGGPYINALDMNVVELTLYGEPYQKRHPLPFTYNGRTYDLKTNAEAAVLNISQEGQQVSTTTMPRSFTYRDRELLERILRDDTAWLELPELGLHGKPLVGHS